MSVGPTRIPSFGACIYCGATESNLSDEHVVPFAVGGAHILEDASCDACAKITSRFEWEVCRQLWGEARKAYGGPSYRKKKWPSHTSLKDPKESTKTHSIAYADYPAPLIFYKAPVAGVLDACPETIDRISSWLPIAIVDRKAQGFEAKHGFQLSAVYKHVPDSFARMLAKIGYGHILTALAPGDFAATCLPYILGTKPNVSFIVGSDPVVESVLPNQGYLLKTEVIGTTDHAHIIARVRLFAHLDTPTYHIVVGETRGRDALNAVVQKFGPGTVTVYGKEATAPKTTNL